jgi:shikimate dehydrogenase
MHNAAIAALGLDAVYVALPLPASAVADFFRVAGALALAGNVTVPHKLAAFAAIPRRTPIAERLGAVNTFWTEKGALVGDNTDVAGVLDALARLEAPAPWVVAGTGGSARAVAAAAAERQAALLVRSRDATRAGEFVAWAKSIGAQASPDDGSTVGTAINATPLGLAAKDSLPISMERLKGCQVALDLVYAKGETAWVLACRGRGLRAQDGRGMLVGQGLQAFERFFPGAKAPREVMRAAVEAALR